MTLRKGIKALACILGLAGMTYANAAEEKKKNVVYCAVPFEARKANADADKIKSCFTKGKKVTSVLIFGTTSQTNIQPDPSLSAQRAENAARIVRDLYPKARIEARGCGIMRGPNAKSALLIIGGAGTSYEIAKEKREGCKFLSRKLEQAYNGNVFDEGQTDDVIKKEKETTKFVYGGHKKDLDAWIGAVVLFPSSPLSNYAQKQLFGLQVGVRKKLIGITPKLFFYPALAAEYASINKASSSAGIDGSGLDNRSAFSIANLYLMGGLDYALNRYVSFFGELGFMYTQRDLSVSTNDGTPISSHLSTGLGGVVQLGSHITFLHTSKADVFVRPSVGMTLGVPAEKTIRRNATSTEKVNFEVPIMSAGLSLGVTF